MIITKYLKFTELNSFKSKERFSHTRDSPKDIAIYEMYVDNAFFKTMPDWLNVKGIFSTANLAANDWLTYSETLPHV